MSYKRVLTIQDISCVGQCSMTVALPVLSACGQETCILPTALLSTHTGGFGKPEVVHFDVVLEKLWRHWQKNEITFDAILVGYLGSKEAIVQTEWILRELLAPGGIAIVDPAMGDHGRLYSGFDMDYVAAMESLCRRANILLPNVTEAALLSGNEYRQELTEEYVHALLQGLPSDRVVLTGVGFAPDMTGAAVRDGERIDWHFHQRLGSSYHGTGDLFAAAFTGALMSGKSLMEAVRIAASFVSRAIENTQKAPAHWYGVKFETALPELIRMIGV